MSTDIPSIVSHVSLGGNRFEEASASYEKLLATLGARGVMAHPGAGHDGQGDFELARKLGAG